MNLFCFSICIWSLVACVSCSRASTEKANVLAAIDALRDAPAQPPEVRNDLIRKLKEIPVSTKQIDLVRSDCVAAYEQLSESNRLESQVREQLKDPSKLSMQAALDLAEAEKKIKQSSISMQACENGIRTLKYEK